MCGSSLPSHLNVFSLWALQKRAMTSQQWMGCVKEGKGKTQRILFDFLQIGQTVSPQSIPTTSLEVKNGVNCEHSPVDLSKVSRDVEVGSQA